jgi:hypothetical protein
LPRLLKAAGILLTSADAYTIIETECNKDSFGEEVIEGVQKAAILRGIAAREVDEWVQELHSRAAGGDYYFCINRFIFSATKQ